MRARFNLLRNLSTTLRGRESGIGALSSQSAPAAELPLVSPTNTSLVEATKSRLRRIKVSRAFAQDPTAAEAKPSSRRFMAKSSPSPNPLSQINSSWGLGEGPEDHAQSPSAGTSRAKSPATLLCQHRLPARFATVATIAIAMVATSFALNAAHASALSKHVFSTSFAGQGSNALSNPSDVAVDQSTHDVYVVDRGNHRVEKFDSSGNLILMVGQEVNKTKSEQPNASRAEKDLCTVASGDTCQMARLRGGKSDSDIQPGDLSAPELIAVDNSGGLSQGDFYVSSVGGGGPGYNEQQNYLSKFEPSGHIVSSWENFGQLPLAFAYANFTKEHRGTSERPTGVAVDSSGDLYFSVGGGLLGKAGTIYRLGQFGFFVGSFYTEKAPTHITIGPGGNLLEFQSDDVHQPTSPTGVHALTPTGEQLGVLTGPGFIGPPTALAADISRGETYVGDAGTAIHQYDAACDPSLANCIPADSFGAPQLGSATGLAVDESSGIVYVADAGNDRVDVYTPAPNLPDLSLAATTDPTATGATLNGKVDPAEAGDVTNCAFEYVGQQTFQEGDVDEAQRLTISGAGSGTFTLTFKGQTTAPLTFDARPFNPPNSGGPTVQDNLEELSTIGAHNVSVTGEPGGPFTIEFKNAFARSDVPQLITDSSSLAPPGATVTVETTVQGGDGWGAATSLPCEPSIPYSDEADVHASLSGLTTEAVYRFRLLATNASGTVTSRSNTFTPHHVIGLSTDSPTGITGESATLNGSLLGDNTKTHYYFEWGPTNAYGNNTAPPPGVELASPTGPTITHLTFALNGLKPFSAYHYRIVAENGSGQTSLGEDQTFITPPNPPQVSAETAVEVHGDTAVLHAQVNPGAGDTVYHAEYGTAECTEPGHSCESTPMLGGHAGGGRVQVAAATPIHGLAPGTVYHYRVVAQNRTATTYGAERTFTTLPFVDLENDPCPNAHVRQQTGAGGLPDCRAYELVSAADAGGYDVESDLVPGQTPFGGYPKADGRVLYGVHDGGIPGTNHPTNRGVDPYVASRGEEGWSTEYVGIPATNSFSAGPFSSLPSGVDAGLGIFAFGGQEACSPCFEGGYTGIPVHESNGTLDGALVQGMISSGVTPPGPSAEATGHVGKGLSANGEHLVFGSTSLFAPGGNDETGDLSIYDRNLKTEVTHTVSKTPAGATMTGPGIAELDMSSDGSRIVLGRLVSEVEGNSYYHLYMNIGDSTYTVDLSPGATQGVLYDGMSADGSRVFFTAKEALATAAAQDTDTSADIYEAEPGDGSEEEAALTRISRGSEGTGDTDFCEPVADSASEHWNTTASEENCGAVAVGGGGGVAAGDGTIYFLSPEKLDGSSNGTQDAPNLYVARPVDGFAPHYVTTLESALNAPDPPKLKRTFAHNFGSFAAASGLATDQSSGDVYVLDDVTNTVEKFDSSGAPITSFGDSSPTPNGKLIGSETPNGSFFELPGFGANQLAVDPSGNLYVPDLFGGVIDVFDSAGGYLSQISGVPFPTGVAVDPTSGDVYVSSFFGNVYRFDSNGEPVSQFSIGEGETFFSAMSVAFDASSGHVYVTRQPEGGAIDTATYTITGGFLGKLDTNPSKSVTVDSSNGDVYVDEESQIGRFDSAGSRLETLGVSSLSGSVGVAIDPEGQLYATDAGGAEVAVFTPSLAHDPLIDSPLVLDSVGDSTTRHTADFQLSPDGQYAVFASTLPLTGHLAAGHQQIFRYDAADESLRCASCNPTSADSTAEATLASDGLSLTDDGRVFFTTAEALAAGDTDNISDVYEWQAPGTGTCQSGSLTFNGAIDSCLGLISAGTSTFDSGLLSATANGKDAFFFTRDSLARQDENGPTMKLYDARENGGFPYLFPAVTCRASDECHGAASPAPGALKVGSGTVTPPGPTHKECKPGFVLRHHKCVRKHKHRKHHRRAHHNRGGEK